MYLRRHLEEKLLKLAPYFKIILVRGARQVGKSTLLGHLFPEFKHIVFDSIQDIYGVAD